ncbi:hypothetical protein GGI35DRAFT_437059 [Trichoderma velutinum]
MATPFHSKLLPKKSRAGCSTCRVRRVKCDEVRPVCGNCKRRFVHIDECNYRTAHSRRRAQAREKSLFVGVPILTDNDTNARGAGLGHPLALHPPSLHQVSQYRSRELFLVHYYTTVVAPSMPNCNEVSSMNMWQRVIPQIAFESEVILNPMLTLSALHFHSHNPNNSSMALVVSYYLDRTLFHHKLALASSDGQLTEQIWLSAILLCILSWLLAHEIQKNQRYELPLHAWRLKHGISQLYVSRYDDLREMGYGWFGYERVIRTISINKLPPQSKQGLLAVEGDMLDLFKLFDLSTLHIDERDIYDEARDYVLNLYRAYYAGISPISLRRYIGTMTNRCQDGFLKLLFEHDPLAMAIMARCLVLLKGMEEVWWMNGKGKYEVVERSVRGMKDLMPKSVSLSMDWPCRVLDGTVVLNRPVGEESEADDYEPSVAAQPTHLLPTTMLLDT